MNNITDNHIQLIELAKEWINEGDKECGVELLKIVANDVLYGVCKDMHIVSQSTSNKNYCENYCELKKERLVRETNGLFKDDSYIY